MDSAIQPVATWPTAACRRTLPPPRAGPGLLPRATEFTPPLLHTCSEVYEGWSGRQKCRDSASWWVGAPVKVRRQLPAPPAAAAAGGAQFDGPGNQVHSSHFPHTFFTSYSGCWSAGVPEIDCPVGRRRGQELRVPPAVAAQRVANDQCFVGDGTRLNTVSPRRCFWRVYKELRQTNRYLGAQESDRRSPAERQRPPPRGRNLFETCPAGFWTLHRRPCVIYMRHGRVSRPQRARTERQERRRQCHSRRPSRLPGHPAPFRTRITHS